VNEDVSCFKFDIKASVVVHTITRTIFSFLFFFLLRILFTEFNVALDGNWVQLLKLVLCVLSVAFPLFLPT